MRREEQLVGIFGQRTDRHLELVELAGLDLAPVHEISETASVTVSPSTSMGGGSGASVTW